MKDISGLINAEFSCLDYKDVIIPKGSVVYADPPYAKTTGYDKIVGEFNHEEFWEYMRKISKDNIVLISEYTMPDDFECIWKKNIKCTLNNKQVTDKTEKLFIYRGN